MNTYERMVRQPNVRNVHWQVRLPRLKWQGSYPSKWLKPGQSRTLAKMAKK